MVTTPRPLIVEERPSYMSHPGMAWARFVEGPEGATSTTPQDDDPKEPEPTPKEKATEDHSGTDPKGKPGDDGGEEELRGPGKRALDAERAAAKDLRRKLDEANAKLAKIEDAKLSDIDRANKERDAAKTLAESLQSQLDVRELAAEHGITDAGDFDLLASVTDTTARAALAARLSQVDEPGEDPAPPAPNSHLRPSRISGRGGSKAVSSVQSGRDAYAARHPSKK